MADLMTAAARRALLATPTIVDHRRPIHDQLCRCRACKPAGGRSREMRRRAWTAIAVLIGTFWTTLAYAVLR
jgi:hypothetical protein